MRISLRSRTNSYPHSCHDSCVSCCDADGRFVKADICDKYAVEGILDEERPDAVVNFAVEKNLNRPGGYYCKETYAYD
jgi:dTDP-D-glucose 4,6-dehydratase